jgi:hypothetical protein
LEGSLDGLLLKFPWTFGICWWKLPFSERLVIREECLHINKSLAPIEISNVASCYSGTKEQVPAARLRQTPVKQWWVKIAVTNLKLDYCSGPLPRSHCLNLPENKFSNVISGVFQEKENKCDW